MSSSISDFTAQCQLFEAATLDGVPLGQSPSAQLQLPQAALKEKVAECEKKNMQQKGTADKLRTALAQALTKHLHEYSPPWLASATQVQCDRSVWELFGRLNVLGATPLPSYEKAVQSTVALVEEFSLTSAEVRNTKQSVLCRAGSTTLGDIFRFFFCDSSVPCSRSGLPHFKVGGGAAAAAADSAEEAFKVFSCPDLESTVAHANVITGGSKGKPERSEVQAAQHIEQPADKKLDEFPAGCVLVFRHLRDSCDHVLVVSGVERVTLPSEASLSSPLRIYLRKRDVEYCDLCGAVPAALAAYGCRLAPPPSHPALFCRSCYDLLHGQSTDLRRDDGECCVMGLPKIE